MLHGIYHVRLKARGQGSALPTLVTFTIELPFVDIYASTALTAFSAGVLHGTPGGPACYIKQYGVRSAAPRGYSVITLTDPIENSIYLPKCNFIQFRLAVVQTEAFAQGTVLVLSPSQLDDADSQRRSLAVDFEDDKQQLLGSHEFSLLANNSSVPLEELIEATSREIAYRRSLEETSIRAIRREGNETILGVVQGPT